MLGLAQQVRRNPFWIIRCVRNDEDFGRPGDHINAYAPVKLSLGLRHPCVAWADDDVNRCDCFGTKGECPDGLGAANPPYLVHARKCCSR